MRSERHNLIRDVIGFWEGGGDNLYSNQTQ